MRCVLDPNDKIVDCPPTFTMYAFDADVNDAKVVTVPRLDGFKIDVEGVKRAVREHSPKMVSSSPRQACRTDLASHPVSAARPLALPPALSSKIFLTSPNNPDGSIMEDDVLLEILKLPILVVLDEAYIEFADRPSKMKWVQQYDNLIVLRTFSKSAGLAGLRIGYGAFPLGLIEYLWRAKQPYNVTYSAEVAACAALTNPGYLDRVRDLLVQERERMMALLRTLPYLEPFPSHSNFILCKVTNGYDGKTIRDRCVACRVAPLPSSRDGREPRRRHTRLSCLPLAQARQRVRGDGPPLRQEGALGVHPDIGREARADRPPHGGPPETLGGRCYAVWGSARGYRSGALREWPDGRSRGAASDRGGDREPSRCYRSTLPNGAPNPFSRRTWICCRGASRARQHSLHR